MWIEGDYRVKVLDSVEARAVCVVGVELRLKVAEVDSVSLSLSLSRLLDSRIRTHLGVAFDGVTLDQTKR